MGVGYLLTTANEAQVDARRERRIMSLYEKLTLAIGITMALILWLQLYMIYRTFRADHERRKKQATVEYVNSIRSMYRPIAEKLLAKFGEQKVINMDEIDSSVAADIKECLSVVEHLAAGVNVGIFDLKIIDRMSGSYFLDMRDRFKPYIKDRRVKRGNDKLYCEFEVLCRDLEKTRGPRETAGSIQYS